MYVYAAGLLHIERVQPRGGLLSFFGRTRRQRESEEERKGATVAIAQLAHAVSINNVRFCGFFPLSFLFHFGISGSNFSATSRAVTQLEEVVCIYVCVSRMNDCSITFAH